MPTRPTAPLTAQAEAHAIAQHRHRLAEIAALAPLLDQLDAFVPKLAAVGLVVWPDNLRLHHGHVGTARRFRALRLNTRGLCGESAPRWLRALLTAGFSEVTRTAGDFGLVELNHGTLRLIVDAPRDPVEAAASAAKFARRQSEAAAVAVHAVHAQVAPA